MSAGSAGRAVRQSAPVQSKVPILPHFEFPAFFEIQISPYDAQVQDGVHDAAHAVGAGAVGGGQDGPVAAQGTVAASGGFEFGQGYGISRFSIPTCKIEICRLPSRRAFASWRERASLLQCQARRRRPQPPRPQSEFPPILEFESSRPI